MNDGYVIAPTVSTLKNTGVTGNTTQVVPAQHVITGIYILNNNANAITGGIRIGTTAAGIDVVSAFAVAGNFIGHIPVATISKKYFSSTASQTLFIEAVTAWNSANINIYFTVQPLG